MKPNNPKELIEKARQAPRPSGSEVPEIPHGFASRVVTDLPKENGPSKLRILEWSSYAGVGAAACVALVATLQIDESTQDEGMAADPWLEMPMSSEL